MKGMLRPLIMALGLILKKSWAHFIELLMTNSTPYEYKYHQNIFYLRLKKEVESIREMHVRIY